MNKFYMNGKLIHKASDHNTKRCEVEKWVFLPHSDFERLKANPYQEHEAITAARDLMYEDKNAYHSIMLLDEYCEDGLLIEAEGFDYPRLSMFVPDAKSIYERYQTSESELKLHDMIKDTVEKIAELAHTDKTDFTSADMIDMDEVESLIKNAIVQQLAQRDDIKMAENTDIGVDFQPDIHVEAEKLTELKFYCPLKVQREIKPSFDEDEDEFFEDTEELSDFEVLEYEKAEKEYKKCIDEKLNLKYACTGYVRTLSALGKIEKAEQFISNSPEKIYKVALDELKDAKKGKKKNHNKDYIEEASNEELTEISSIEHKSTFQFSKESILEDELEERLLAGTTVFGIPLKIFKRKGIYGRQWSFAGLGRIDLLAEDNDGNLYVIELKKDSGYDDAYTQTVKYVEWFEKSKYAKGKKVYGIICVNDPPQKLINSVQKDDRVRLFEYRVSYSEIK